MIEPLSTKLQADYVELANQYLDHLPVESPRDLKAIEEALLSIIDTIHPHAIAPSLQGRITEVKELLDHPDLYVEREEHYPEYRGILLGRIAAKITEITLLMLPDHQQELGAYIAEQKAERKHGECMRSLLARAHVPLEGSAAHTLTEAEWQHQEERRLILEEIRANPDDRELALEAVERYGELLEFLGAVFQNEEEIVFNALAQNSKAFAFAAKPIALRIVSTDGLWLEHASCEQRNDDDIVNAAWLQNPKSLSFASKRIVLRIVQANGLLLEYASSLHKDDEDIASAALAQNPGAAAFASLNYVMSMP